MDSFFANEVTKITGVKLNRLQMWMGEGWIVPSIQKAEGKGSRNKFSRDDLYTISLFKELIESGFSRNLAGEVFKSCYLSSHVQPIRYLLTSAGDDHWIEIQKRGDGKWRATIKNPQHYTEEKGFIIDRDADHFKDDVRFKISINMKKIINEVDEKVLQMV